MTYDHKTYNQQYYQANKEKFLKRSAQYNKKHRKEKNDYERKRRTTKKYKEYIKNYQSSPQKRYWRAQHDAEKNGKSFNLTLEDYTNLISQPCIYCDYELGTKVLQGSGLDRIDNTIGYELSNVQSCCMFCNYLRGDRLTVEETHAAIQAIIALRKSKV
jgi:hypothetical protein